MISLDLKKVLLFNQNEHTTGHLFMCSYIFFIYVSKNSKALLRSEKGRNILFAGFEVVWHGHGSGNLPILKVELILKYLKIPIENK